VFLLLELMLVLHRSPEKRCLYSRPNYSGIWRNRHPTAVSEYIRQKLWKSVDSRQSYRNNK